MNEIPLKRLGEQDGRLPKNLKKEIDKIIYY